MNRPAKHGQSLFTVVPDDGTAVVSMHRPELTDEDNIELLGRQLYDLVEKHRFRRVLINLAGVAYVTSSVVGKLITLHRKLVRNGGTLVLCSLNDALEEVLETSRLLSYFNTAPSVDAARKQYPMEG